MNQSTPDDQTAQDPNVLDWREIKNFGIDPAPAGLSEDEEVQPN